MRVWKVNVTPKRIVGHFTLNVPWEEEPLLVHVRPLATFVDHIAGVFDANRSSNLLVVVDPVDVLHVSGVPDHLHVHGIVVDEDPLGSGPLLAKTADVK